MMEKADKRMDVSYQLSDVEAASRHTGGDEHVAEAALEVGDGGDSVELLLAPVDRQARVSRLVKLCVQPICQARRLVDDKRITE